MRLYSMLTLALLSQPVAAVQYHSHPAVVRPLTHALRVGIDTNNLPLFLCTARIFNSVQPGKTWPGYGRCNVAYGGKEYIVDRYEIPSASNFHNVAWQDNDYGAVVVGRDTNGKPLFLCQTFFKGSRQPGKTWPGYGHCNIAYAGQEIITNHYRVLGRSQGANHYHQHPTQGQPRAIIR